MRLGRRNLLKMIGLSPVLLVPWTPASEQLPAPAPTPPPPLVPPEPERLTVEEGLKRIDWSTLRSAGAYAATASTGFRFGVSRWDNDHQWGE